MKGAGAQVAPAIHLPLALESADFQHNSRITGRRAGGHEFSVAQSDDMWCLPKTKMCRALGALKWARGGPRCSCTLDSSKWKGFLIKKIFNVPTENSHNTLGDSLRSSDPV